MCIGKYIMKKCILFTTSFCFLVSFCVFFFVLWLVTIAQFVEAKAILPGPSDLYVKTGSEVVLTCIVSQGPHELGTILWYQGNNPFLGSFFFIALKILA